MEQTILVTLAYQGGPPDTDESLAELQRLTATAGGEVVLAKKFSRTKPDAALFFGSGQVSQLADRLRVLQADLLIVDHELRPVQQRNLEAALRCRVIDRTQLILDIFARRAHSHEGKLQVELAQLSYLLPRLTGKGVALSRLGGGIGTRGPGETKLEYDRRRVRDRIVVLKKQLRSVAQTRFLHRQDREAVPLPLVSLVGYTNAGKSALLNALTGEKALVEDKLFATLDLATRKVILPPSLEILLTDTVGFIRRLPHYLVAAFRGTLEEVVSADLLLHVVDGADADAAGHILTVRQVLGELGARDKATILLLNKADIISRNLRARLTHQFPTALLVSAVTGQGLDRLRREIGRRLARDWPTVTLRLPYAEADLRALILRRGRVLRESFGATMVTLRAQLPPKLLGQIEEIRRRYRQEHQNGDRPRVRVSS